MSHGSDWNPSLYESRHSFVWEHGRDLVEVLAPRAGERILDAGCGTGQLTAEIARSGARVTGIDRSHAMIQQARENFTSVEFQVVDVTALEFRAEFDAVFSNAVLHWVKDAPGAAAALSGALRPGGRFVAEFGGRGNLRSLLDAAYEALRTLGFSQPEELNPWYFPSIGEYATVLEQQGLAVTSAVLFDRPTPLEGSLADWFAMFGAAFTERLNPDQVSSFIRIVEERAAPVLRKDGLWSVDYRRLRIVATKE